MVNLILRVMLLASSSQATLGFMPCTAVLRVGLARAGRTAHARGGLRLAQALDQQAAAAALSETTKDARRRLVEVGFAPNTFAADLGFGAGEFQVCQYVN